MGIDFSLYVITDERFLNISNIAESVEKAILGGATIIQYRAKKKNTKEMYEEALVVREITKRYNIPFIVNDRLDLALAVKADGVHVGQEDLPVNAIKAIVGNDFIVGLSTHNLNQVKRANEEMLADYIGFGPVFPTTTKENPDPVTGTDLLCKAVRISKIPVVATGGINEKNVDDVLKCKPAGVAVVRAAFEKGDPYKNVLKLKRKAKELNWKKL
ncbi:Thiamine-phosphate pyrophosphorylase [Desulfurobacterium thermolithotrophum DSM 11699]|uniref:Thiamine-phosphate synthase n=1 Tax=Desulfurobacterium thermolithotrophum (strain DSM 11699 / BSA) TaxID=868864 RepID=F0S2U0_DESTD|nr:thiamine phosphate synthase [Desulfurobacterium thermolithotrophum]ADY73162.1 Thiamine-phosphate pyrophosphorylase [Desulfurobacterium thermolithotrophum DSM 11699]